MTSNVKTEIKVYSPLPRVQELAIYVFNFNNIFYLLQCIQHFNISIYNQHRWFIINLCTPLQFWSTDHDHCSAKQMMIIYLQEIVEWVAYDSTYELFSIEYSSYAKCCKPHLKIHFSRRAQTGNPLISCQEKMGMLTLWLKLRLRFLQDTFHGLIQPTSSPLSITKSTYLVFFPFGKILMKVISH